MNGMDMLVNAALKATGFSREQLDEGMTKGKTMIDDFERRLSNVENMVREIHDAVILKSTQSQPQGIAHDADVDAQSN